MPEHDAAPTEQADIRTTDAEPPEAAEEASSKLDEVKEDPDTFPRDYVEKLRRENARYRERAQQADTLAQHLLAATVQATCSGTLADPADLLAYHSAEDLADENGLPDEDAIRAAADELLLHKPHLAARKPAGDIGQGARASQDTVSLSGMLRARAG